MDNVRDVRVLLSYYQYDLIVTTGSAHIITVTLSTSICLARLWKQLEVEVEVEVEVNCVVVVVISQFSVVVSVYILAGTSLSLPHLSSLS